MIRTSIALTALAITVSASAQVPITVHDAETKEAVPYAHVLWQELNTTVKGVEVAGPDGKVTLPLHADMMKDGVAIHIDFIGYRPVIDTLHTLVARSYDLKHASEFDLDDVVVTGQYRPTTADKAVQRMHVISAEQIQRMAAHNLGDVLGQELNMRLAQDNVLGTSLSMRGLGGENVKILVDGVPVIGRQDGNLDLAQIDLSGIDRVEVLEGPLSVSYGTNALAGTINLITRKNTGDGSSLKAIAYAEAEGRLNLSVAAGQRFGKSDVLLTLGRNFFGGWGPDQGGTYDFSAHNADSTRYQPWKPREQYFGRLNYRYALNKDWDLNYKGVAMQDRITDRGMPRAPYDESAFDSEYLTQRLDNALFANGKAGRDHRIHGLVAYHRYDRTRSTWLRDLTTLETQPVPGESDDSHFTLTNVRGTWSSTNDTARLGYELGMDINVETAAGDLIADGTTQRIGDYAAFGSAQWRPIQQLVVRPGLRYAHNTKYDAPLVPSLDTRLQLGHFYTLRASYAEGFRSPSLKELYLYFVDVNHDIHGNPDLAAETSNNYTLSLSYRKAMEKGVLRGEVTGFHDRVHNLITLAQENGTLYTYINVGEYRTLGGSFSLGWDNGHWALKAGTALTGRYDTLGLKNGGPSYEFTPSANVNVTRSWRKQGWSITAFGKYQGEQQNYIYQADGSIGRGHIASYLMADASVSKELCHQRLNVAVGCKNIGNVTDLNATLGNGGAHSDAGAGSVPLATGRTYFLRLSLSLKGKTKEAKP
jgi:outer membrane receptor for ferrienterochelin and colicins